MKNVKKTIFSPNACFCQSRSQYYYVTGSGNVCMYVRLCTYIILPEPVTYIIIMYILIFKNQHLRLKLTGRCRLLCKFGNRCRAAKW